VLVLTVSEGKSPLEYKFREVTLKYNLEKDSLKIECKEPLQAGRYLGRYNISGTWVRITVTFGVTAKRISKDTKLVLGRMI
jgi:hypothetical protein